MLIAAVLLWQDLLVQSFRQVVTNNNQVSSDQLKVMLELYKTAVEEYRFQVNLNWDRNKFYVLLNSGLITASCGLLRTSGFKFAEFLTLPLFILGFLAAWLGYKTLIKGIEYRRRAVIKKTQIEQKFTTYSDILPIDTTEGMRQAQDLLADPEAYYQKTPRFGTISYFLAALFIVLMIVNFVALLYLGLLGLKFVAG